MRLAESNGWNKAARAKWALMERPDWRCVKSDYKLAALRAKARFVALHIVEGLLNVVINNVLHEVAEQEKARVAALVRVEEWKEAA